MVSGGADDRRVECWWRSDLTERINNLSDTCWVHLNPADWTDRTGSGGAELRVSEA